MSEIERIADELQREHDGDPWHGSPLMQILQGINADQATARPIAGAHSIWELVLHITAWKNEVRRRLSGAPAGEPEEGDWPAAGPSSAQAWRQALDRLESAHRGLVAGIRALPEGRLFEPTNDQRDRPLGSGVSYYVLLHGIVQHDAYHAGQIAILKKGLAP
jgi:uncharacterized damage-inducible protein DinB